jgi:metal-responsive CopG/Arc/MetJ family transcriptional regulator
MAEEPDKQFINIAFDDKLLTRIDDFRFKQRFASRTEAIRWLIKAALDAKLAPKGE